MRFESNARDGQDFLPTFFQWCKDHSSQTTALKYTVVKIWLPNKFPDLTIETEVFRLRVSHKATIFWSVLQSIEKITKEGLVLAVSEIDKTLYDYTLEVMEGESGLWEELGEFGRKCTVQDKPKSPRKSRKR